MIVDSAAHFAHDPASPLHTRQRNGGSRVQVAAGLERGVQRSLIRDNKHVGPWIRVSAAANFFAEYHGVAGAVGDVR